MVQHSESVQRLGPSPDDNTAGRPPLGLLALRSLPPRACRLVWASFAACVTALLLLHVAGTQSGRMATVVGFEAPELSTPESWPSRHLALNDGQQPGELYQSELILSVGPARMTFVRRELTPGAPPLLSR
jgi:hypothetical protein